MTVLVPSEKEKSGLTEEQVLANRRQFGCNETPEPPKRGFLQVVCSVLTEPMFLLLLLAAGLYLFTLKMWNEVQIDSNQYAAQVMPAKLKCVDVISRSINSGVLS